MPIPAETLRKFVAEIFVAAGTSSDEGGRIAKHLVGANLTGHDSHGVVRVPRYVLNLQRGEVFAGRSISIERETPIMAVVDGNDGFGQTVTPQAVQLGIDKAKVSGLAAIALRNTAHLGRAGDWAEMAAEHGLVSLHFVNVRGSLLVAPFGGVDRKLSTAPFCLGVPLPGRPLLLLDFATSIVAEGKVLMASRGGKKIPDDALITPEGALNGDPATLYGDLSLSERNPENGGGAIRAFGLHKGSGLNLMCEIMAGVLTGNGTCGPREKPRGVIRNGMLSFYLRPDMLGSPEEMASRAERFITFLKASRPATPGGEVLVPGEVEARTRAEREANGVPIPPDAWASITAVARSLGLGDNAIPSAA